MGHIGSFTRVIKVQQLEAAMRTAVASQRGAVPDKMEAKTRAVQALASRLLAARLQVLRSRISDMQPKGIKDTGVRTKIAELEDGGVAVILAEFRALQS